jgi:hypothetical protein
MVSNSESFFQRTLDEKTTEAIAAVQECVTAFLAADPGGRQKNATSASDAVNRIVKMLHPQDRPYWLTQLLSSLELAKNHHNDYNGIEAMQKIASELQPALIRHKWKLADIESAEGFDFDAIYSKYKGENKIPELFDEIIAAMTRIVESREIDSVKALNELLQVIATLKNARNGSYFATRNAWFFVATWFKNTGWELLSDIPVLGATVRGLRKTMEDMNDGMQNMHDQIQEDLGNQLIQGFPRLEYHAPYIPKLEYTEINSVENSTQQNVGPNPPSVPSEL